MNTRRVFFTASAGALAAAATPPRSAMGLATTCYMTVRRFKDTVEFLEHCHSLGAGGIQASLTSTAPEYVSRLRRMADQYGMFIEVMAGLPRTGGDTAFERTLVAAKEAGALCVRSACLGGRRYETFSTLEDWKQFVASSHQAISRAVPLAEKHKMPWALENHKDWTTGEFAALLKQYSSEYLGVCLDTGNNMALLDDPMELVESLAPYAFSTHLKDMAVEEYPDGFLLAEVPFGEGMLDMQRIVQIIAKARPKTKMTLEMITRDPLKIPCFTGNYWATFPGMPASRLARMISMVRKARVRKPIPLLSTLPPKAQMQLEEDNVKACLNYARTRMAL